jgi:pyruvate dehydrogenase E2 component (dihydrolipoamide acetyltransferase)
VSFEVKVPRLDEVQETARVTKWYKSNGENVLKGEIISSIETMKVSFDIESPVNGQLEEILVREGTEVPVGAVLCRIRIAEVGRQVAGAQYKAPAPPQEVEYEVIRLDPIRREISRRMSQSHGSIAAARVTVRICAEPVLSLKERLEQSSGRRVSFTAIIVSKVARTLLRHRKFNSVYFEDEWRSYHRAHVCVAMQGRKGLMSPVLRNADLKDALQLSDEVEALQKKVDEERLSVEDVGGGTFTVTNLGPYGILSFDAIINAPQVAILAVGSVTRELDLVENQAPSFKSFIYLTLAFDHRLVDGYDAAIFLSELKRDLEEQPNQ